MPELPPQVTRAKYLAVYDEAALLKVIELPDAPGVLYFNGTDVLFARQNITLDLQERSTPVLGLVGIDSAGRLWNFKAPMEFEHGYLRVRLNAATGLISFAPELSLPELGSSFGLVGASGDTYVLFGNSSTLRGVFTMNGAGVPEVVPAGAAGTYLRVGADGLEFGAPGSTSSGGGGNLGVSGVAARNISGSAIRFTGSSLNLASVDGGEIQVSDFSEDVDFSIAAGPNGLDTGTIANSRWYHIYILGNADGDISAVASLSITNPTLDNTPDYTHYGYAGMCYVKSSGAVRPFKQIGNTQWFEETTYVANGNISTIFVDVAGDVALATIVPPNVKTVSGRVGGGSVENTYHFISVASNVAGIGAQFCFGENFPVGIDGFRYTMGNFHSIPIYDPTVPTISWKAQVAATGKCRMTLNRFTF